MSPCIPRRLLIAATALASLMSPLSCGSGPNGASALNDTPSIQATPRAPWTARHGLTAAQYQNEVVAQQQKGYRLTYVSGYAVNNEARFAALWEQADGPAWEARHNLTGPQYQAEFTALQGRGYRPVLVNGYTVNGTDFYTAIWHKASGAAQVARHGMTAEDYQAQFNTLTNMGYRLRHLSGYGPSGQVRFAAIFDKSAGPAWLARHGMSAGDYQQQFNTQRANGFHPVMVNGYPTARGIQYAAIWEQGDSLPWQARHSQSPEAYQQNVTELRYQGYRPVAISGFADPNGAQYAALWQNDRFSRAELAAIDSQVNGVMTSTGVPAISLAVTKNGRLVFAKAYGRADIASNTPATTSSLFRIASISKPITAATILRLHERTRLRLTDRVFGPGSLLGTTYTAAPKDARVNSITVQQLLSHTSGLWTNDNNDPMFQDESASQAQLIKKMLETRDLAFAPGADYAYSNFGYMILGRVIEKVTGQSYESWVKNDILDPAFTPSPRIGGNTAGERLPREVSYYDDAESRQYSHNVRRMDAHGGWVASPIDLVRFASRFDGFDGVGDFLQPETERLMTTVTPQSAARNMPYGLGWQVTGSNTWWHNGSLPGTISILARRADGLAWSAVTNSKTNNPNIDDMMWRVVGSVSQWPDYDLF